MAGDARYNQMTPADADLFATLTRLGVVKGISLFKQLTGVLHSLKNFLRRLPNRDIGFIPNCYQSEIM